MEVMMAGLEKQLAAGARQAQAVLRHGFSPARVHKMLPYTMEAEAHRLLASGSARPVMIEWCCDIDSALSLEASARGCIVHRFDGRSALRDVTTTTGREAAHRIIRAAGEMGRRIYMHASLPCTSWSPWQNLNARTPRAKQQLAATRARSTKMVADFTTLARLAVKHRATVTYEWPASSAGWHAHRCPAIEPLRAVLRHQARVDGCGF